MWCGMTRYVLGGVERLTMAAACLRRSGFVLDFRYHTRHVTVKVC